MTGYGTYVFAPFVILVANHKLVGLYILFHIVYVNKFILGVHLILAMWSSTEPIAFKEEIPRWILIICSNQKIFLKILK